MHHGLNVHDNICPVVSILTADESELCDIVRMQCIVIQERLSAYRSRRQNTASTTSSLKLIELYNTTLAHLDSACNTLAEISQQ